MKPRLSVMGLLLLLASLGGFVVLSSQSLPPVVVSHFDAHGAANGSMPRGAYTIVMLLLVVGVPLLVGFLPSSLVGPQGNTLRIPNRDYWLSPERRDSTLEFIRAHGRWFGAALAIFLAYVHWLVVQGNQMQPPVLPLTALYGGLVVFVIALAVWLGALYGRFRIHT